MKISGFGYLIKEGLRNVWNNRIMSLASIGVLISSLVLTGAALLLSMNVAEIVDSVGDSNVTTVYLKDDVSDLEAVYIGKDIQKISNIETCVFYSKDDAILDYKESLGEEVFENIIGDNGEKNPLPHAFHITMTDLSQYNETVDQIMKIDQVQEVGNRAEAAKALTNLSNLISTLSFWIVLALGVISLFIISNTIRVTMYSRRFEISIMKSVGATNAFVSIPFVIEGMFIGLLSGLLSSVGLMLIYDVILQIIESIIPFTTIPFSVVALPITGAFILAGMVIGAIGAFISIRKYLKKEGNEILGW